MAGGQQETETDDLVECIDYLGGTKWLPKRGLRFRPSVYAVVRHGGRLLVVTGRRNGRYFLPGGGVELGERIESALRREVKEETGIAVAVGDLLGVEESFYYYGPHDVSCHGILFFYRCMPRTFDLLSDEQVDDAWDGNPHWVDVPTLKAEDFQGHGETIIEMVARIAP
jgi:8-oxo-dGTP diphosphatase